MKISHTLLILITIGKLENRFDAAGCALMTWKRWKGVGEEEAFVDRFP